MADKFLFLTSKQWDFMELSSASIVLLTAIREAADVVEAKRYWWPFQEQKASQLFPTWSRKRYLDHPKHYQYCIRCFLDYEVYLPTIQG